MGLDQWAYAVKDHPGLPDTDHTPEDGESVVQLQTWRKHPNLQGWMESKYRAKGGKAEQFNCCSVRITLEDLEILERQVRCNKLPKTVGFFFGVSQPGDHDLDIDFIVSAREAIMKDLAVYYTSWW